MPFCSCFKFFSGEDCEIQSAELKAIQTIDSIALVISILFIIAIYAVFVLNDILNYFLCMKIKLKIQREKEKDELIEKKKKKKRNSKHLKKIYPS
jgi:high-affinity nickel permease